ncbi:MAG: Na+/H+ antiporter subunit E [Chloroflexota bacterium]|nr:Na+/H+ antiporter subunit E [Chloroflexota bacterium]
MQNILAMAVIAAPLWCFFQNSVTIPNLIVGFVVGAVVGLLVKSSFSHSVSISTLLSVRKWLRLADYLIHLNIEIIKANFKVARLVITPGKQPRSGIIAVPVDVEGDVSVTAFGNSITLTPSTITLLVSKDKKTFYVHALDIDDPEQSKREMKETLEMYISRIGQ